MEVTTLRRVHFVEFWAEGRIANSCLAPVEVDERDPKKVSVPDGVTFFVFYDKIVGLVTDGSESIPISSDRHLNRSPKYFCQGTIYSLAEIKRNFPEKTDVIQNMIICKIERVIRTGPEGFYAFFEGDVLIEPAKIGVP